MKAKYIGKSYGTGYERDFVFLEYEYRGYTYEVYENRAKGNEPLAWQHKSHQAEIDRIIEINARMEENKKNRNEPIETVEESLDRWFRYLDGDEEAYAN